MGLAPLTILHIHAVLKQILTSAVKAKKLTRSPITDIETKPKPTRRDKIEVLDEVELAALLDALKTTGFTDQRCFLPAPVCGVARFVAFDGRTWTLRRERFKLSRLSKSSAANFT